MTQWSDWPDDPPSDPETDADRREASKPQPPAFILVLAILGVLATYGAIALCFDDALAALGRPRGANYVITYFMGSMTLAGVVALVAYRVSRRSETVARWTLLGLLVLGVLGQLARVVRFEEAQTANEAAYARVNDRMGASAEAVADGQASSAEALDRMVEALEEGARNARGEASVVLRVQAEIFRSMRAPAQAYAEAELAWNEAIDAPLTGREALLRRHAALAELERASKELASLQAASGELLDARLAEAGVTAVSRRDIVGRVRGREDGSAELWEARIAFLAIQREVLTLLSDPAHAWRHDPDTGGVVFDDLEVQRRLDDLVEREDRAADAVAAAQARFQQRLRSFGR